MKILVAEDDMASGKFMMKLLAKYENMPIFAKSLHQQDIEKHTYTRRINCC